MSWNVSAIGRAAGVADRIAAEAARYTCMEPEDTIKKGVVAAILGALTAFPAGAAVRVEASGSQSGSAIDGKAANSLVVKIEPLWGFID